MTLEEVADSISMNLPKWKRDANLEFLRALHGLLNDGAIWMSPALGEVYRKTNDGFDLIDKVDSVQ